MSGSLSGRSRRPGNRWADRRPEGAPLRESKGPGGAGARDEASDGTSYGTSDGTMARPRGRPTRAGRSPSGRPSPRRRRPSGRPRPRRPCVVSSSVVIFAEAAVEERLEGGLVDLGEVVVPDERRRCSRPAGCSCRRRATTNPNWAMAGWVEHSSAEVDRLALEGLRHRDVARAERVALLRRVRDPVRLERALAERVRVAVGREAPLELVLDGGEVAHLGEARARPRCPCGRRTRWCPRRA